MTLLIGGGMADSIAATSLIGCRPMCRDFSIKDASKRKKSFNNCRVLSKELAGKRIVSLFAQFQTLKVHKLVIGIEGYFTAIVAAEDVHRGKPDPEMFIYAAQLLKFIPERCIVFGNSNQTVEAAHDVRMKCVAVASKHPVYELGAADLVVRPSPLHDTSYWWTN